MPTSIQSDSVPEPVRSAAKVILRTLLADDLPDYADGLLDHDPEHKALVEKALRNDPEAQRQLDEYMRLSMPLSDAKRDAIAARIHACDPASPVSVEGREVQPIQHSRDLVPTSGIIRKRQWFSGLLGGFPVLQPAIYGLSRAPDVDSQTWRLDLAKLGLPDEERCARVPWAGGVLQISRTNSDETDTTYFAYIELSGDMRSHGVLLVRICTTDGQAFDVRLTKNDRKKRIRAAALPIDPNALHIEVAIE